MKEVYPVFFCKTKNCILIEVPDFNILSEGVNMNDAINMARDAIELQCVSMEDANEPIPQPTDISSLSIANCTFANNGTIYTSLVDIDSSEYRRRTDTKTVRRNVALPSWLNYEAEKSGINVSRILQEALITTLNLDRKI